MNSKQFRKRKAPLSYLIFISLFNVEFTNDDLSPTNMNVFVPKKSEARSHPGKGLEFDLEVLSDEQLINKIFETNTYNHNYESLVEFYSDIYYIMVISNVAFFISIWIERKRTER